ncbi:MAG: aldo/keto reductase, partial [Gammaproteobacteria bacterium]
MKLRALGSTGIKVSPLGLGTVKIGRNEQVKYPQGFKIPDDEHVSGLLALARDLGINFIDTAPAYGTSEQRLGQLLPERDNWVIMTKVGEIFENGQSRFDFSAQHTRQSVENSLKKLRREMIDVVLVHSDGNDMNI